ncbi:MAG: YhfC family glutamic-type intramembrane protease [Ktedonobacteraceae bacterium]
MLHVSPALLVMAVVVTIFVIVYPFILGSIAHHKLAVGWKYFWFGTLVFLVFQLLTRLPLVAVLQNTVLASLLRTSTAFTWTWLVILAVTAGLFEEVGRYVGYRVFMRREPKTWSKAVMFGLGHEGLESMVLVGGQIVLTLLSIAILSAVNVNSLPVAQRQSFIQQVASINALPVWFPLLAAWGRFWSFPLQVALSVMVLQVFRRHQIHWLFLAILFHALIDFLTLALPQAFGQSTTIELLVNGMLCVFGLIGVWIIWRLREPADQARAGEESTRF